MDAHDLKAWRMARGLSREDAAAWLGLTERGLQAKELGNRAVTEQERRLALAYDALSPEQRDALERQLAARRATADRTAAAGACVSVDTKEGERFGLRCTLGGERTRLLQLSGSGRVRLAVGGAGRPERTWWTKPPRVPWEVYEACDGQTYPTRTEAELIARNLFDNSR